MLLRSSSTPILGSLLSSSSPLFPESPSNGFQQHHRRQSVERTTSNSSFLHGIACNYSPLSESSYQEPSKGLRKTRSENNVEDLIPKGSGNRRSQKPPSIRRGDPALETIPSFSMNSSREMEDDQIYAADFSGEDRGERSDVAQSEPLFLARGVGIDRVASGFLNLGGDDGDGRDGNCSVKTDYGGGEGSEEVEMYYKRMIGEGPSNPMILRNYAHFLHQCKRDLPRAEEYYSRAILADPGDADAISKYGNLIWELHSDFDRASRYLELAANMDQDNCYVQAAYASFLWETCEEDEGEEGSTRQRSGGLQSHVRPLISASI
ncbi:hypothetical protein AXF42_Ash018158 [Apostasia shenzhenica]|uniref:Uncharacterized protein n=1 Tax=Apostasia shenzhenica TaxID=1088818 RepID=A0A2I0AF23_9ASPA|nr:hypothetical protein AXF42_Ash018158 [Apostasia shenzhenica]